MKRKSLKTIIVLSMLCVYWFSFRDVFASQAIHCSSHVYGQSELGRDLVYYDIHPDEYHQTILMNFEIHGWEDAYPADGQLLINLANSLINHYQNVETLYETRLIIIPSANPDGVIDGTKNDGFGRCNANGIDLNRDFDANHVVNTDPRNYTLAPFSAKESRALRDLVYDTDPDVVMDFHGWEDCTIGDADLAEAFSLKAGLNHRKALTSAANGYFSYWAQLQGAKALLVEFKSPTDINESDVINAIDTIMAKNYGMDDQRYPINEALTHFCPLQTYARSDGQITTYRDVGDQTESYGYIDGADDLCTIIQIYQNGWIKVRYPVGSTTKTGYCQLTSFINGQVEAYQGTVEENTKVYRKADLATQFGSVWNTDVFTVVSQNDNALQIIYPLDSGGYKMGWITKPASDLDHITLVSLPEKLVYKTDEEFSSEGLLVQAYYTDGTTKDVTSQCTISGFSHSIGSHLISVFYSNQTVTFEVVVEAALTITTQPQSVSGEAGKTVSLHVEAEGNDLTYQWQKSYDGGKTWSNCTSVGCTTDTFSFKLASNQNGRAYRCIVSNNSGSVTSATATVTITETAPVITKQPATVSVSDGDTTSVSVTATGSNLTYQWQKSNDSGQTWSNCTSEEAKKATFNFKATTYMNGRMFRCIVKNGAGSLTSNVATLTVTGKPVITTQPTSAEAEVGDQVSFSIKASGSNLSYQWQRSTDGGKTWVNCTSSGSNTATFTFSMASHFDGRKFRCQVTNTSGTVTSDVATVTLKSGKPVITKQPKSTSTSEGGYVTLAVTATGENLTYQWQRSTDGGKTWANCTSEGSKTNKFSFEMLAKFDGRKFRCQVSNTSGAVTSDVATVTLKTEKPVITKQPKSTSTSEGGYVTLAVTATGENLTYQWQRSTDGGKTWVNCTSEGSKTNTFSFEMLAKFDGRRFRCQVSNTAGTVTSDEVLVKLL